MFRRWLICYYQQYTTNSRYPNWNMAVAPCVDGWTWTKFPKSESELLERTWTFETHWQVRVQAILELFLYIICPLYFGYCYITIWYYTHIPLLRDLPNISHGDLWLVSENECKISHQTLQECLLSTHPGSVCHSVYRVELQFPAAVVMQL